MCDLPRNWCSKSTFSRNQVPASGVVFNTTGKGNDRNAGDKFQTKNVNVKVYCWNFGGNHFARDCKNLLRRKLIRKERLMLRLKNMIMRIIVMELYLPASKISFQNILRIMRIAIFQMQNLKMIAYLTSNLHPAMMIFQNFLSTIKKQITSFSNACFPIIPTRSESHIWMELSQIASYNTTPRITICLQIIKM